MMKIQYLALILLPSIFLGCQEVEGEKDSSLVYFFTDQDGSQVPLDGKADKKASEPSASESEKGYITRQNGDKSKENEVKKGGFFSFFGTGKSESHSKVEPVEVKPSAVERLTKDPVALTSDKAVAVEAPAISEDLLYPSIVEPEAAPESKEAPLAKAYKVLNMGDEKIRVIDRGMGSVNEGDVKKLREQEGR
jgi:hypothetical protein